MLQIRTFIIRDTGHSEANLVPPVDLSGKQSAYLKNRGLNALCPVCPLSEGAWPLQWWAAEGGLQGSQTHPAVRFVPDLLLGLAGLTV